MKDKIIKWNKKIKAVVQEIKLQKISWPWMAVLIFFCISTVSIIAFWVMADIYSNNKIEEAFFKFAVVVKEKVASVREEIPAHYIRRRIDGVYVEPEDADYYPIAVIIDNDPAARPQSGLAKAQIVYEAKAESGVTRFMAIFADNSEVKKIGSVRSARPYFLDWASGYNALFVHVGGSPQALEQIKDENIFNLNEFYQGNYFWRTNNFYAPHNILTSSKNINKYLDRTNAENEGYESWTYKDEAPLDERFATSTIAIDYSVTNFLVQWKYNQEENHYLRYMRGIQHKDADGTPIIAKNIVIMKVKSITIDAELRREMTTIGEGKAWYCFDGVCQEGKWKKSSKKTREKIYDGDGNEVQFNTGTTWIQIIQSDNELDIGY